MEKFLTTSNIWLSQRIGVPDFGIKGVPGGFTKSYMIFLGFPTCRASQAELVLQVVQGHLFEVQINLGLFLPALPQVCADSEPLTSAHGCLPKEKQALRNVHSF